MAEPLDFETTLAARLQARAATASRPFDAAAIASAAVATRAVHRLAIRWPTGAMRWALLAGAALLATLAGALLAGALLRSTYAGPWLAVARSGGVYLTHADGTEPRLLFASGIDVDLAWSADGAYLMVMEHPVRGMVPPPAPVTVLRTDGSIVWSGMVSEMPAWSNHDHRLAYVRDGVLIVTDVDTGVTTTLGGWRLESDTVDWSPDDGRIAATGFSDQHRTTVVVVTLADGTVLDLTPASPSEALRPEWSPDGKYISAWWCGPGTSRGCDGSVSIVIDVATGAQVDGLSDVGWFSRWSPDGSRLAWVVPGEWIHVTSMPTSGGGALRLDAGRIDASGVHDDGLVGWTGDGRGLLVLRENGTTVPDSRPWSDEITYVPGPRPVTDLWQMDVDGSTPVLLVANAFNAAMQPAATIPVAPPRLAISTPLGVYIADADGSNRDVLVDATSDAQVDWSADGQLLLITDQLGLRKTVVRADGTQVWTQSSTAVYGGFGSLSPWSHQGHRLGMSFSDGLILTDLDSGARTAVPDDHDPWGEIAWSPDDRRIAGVKGNGAGGDVLLVAPSDGSAPAHTLPEAATKNVTSMAWSPDGMSIAVVTIPCAADALGAPCPSNLEILDATTGRRIDGIDGVGLGRPIWSQDGSRLAWAGPDETGKLTTVIVGTLPLEQRGADRFLPISVNRWPVAWMPDGSALLVAQDPNPEWQGWTGPNLWRINPDGTNPVLLVENASDGELQPNR